MGKELSAAFDAGFGKFVLEHSGDDVSRLVLGRGKWPGVDVDAAVTAIECRKKIRTKLPEWYAVPEIVYPDRICAEQSSSSETAAYKAGVAERIMREFSSGEMRAADLTGGLGVDSLAFSRVASRVLYNEMDSARASAAVHNFRLLGAGGRIEVSSCCVTPDAQEFWDRLKSFSPSLIYADPARRSASGSKVFLLEDCSPDILTLLPRIFSIAPNLLLKVSPMADLSMLAARVGEYGASVVEAHVVAAAGECKELLLLVKPSPCGSSRLFVNEGGHLLSVDAGAGCAGADSGYVPVFMESPEQLMSAAYLFEPGKALAKAGLFNAVCSLFTTSRNIPAAPSAPSSAAPSGCPAAPSVVSSAASSGCPAAPVYPEHFSESAPFCAAGSRSVHPEHSADPALSEYSAQASTSHSGLVMCSGLSGRVVKAGRSTHLYFTDAEPSADCTMPRMADFGKMFRILEILPLDKRSIKAFSAKYPRAEVSARNIPMSSDELRKKLKVSSGGDVHIFGFRADFCADSSAHSDSADFRASCSPQSANFLLAASRL